tara:strand:+ start:101 stop:796 length:696 start_codon:yes stop_codon:yes gene_type:complete
MLSDVNINIKSLKQINHNIRKYSNNPKAVKLIAVTKTFSYKSINSALENNIYDIGENKVQEFILKEPKIKKTDKLTTHFIGKIQSNKVKKIVSNFDIIHSVDRVKILNKINDVATNQNKKQKILLQVNISNSKTQSGFNKNETLKISNYATKLLNVELIGLMCIASNTKNKKKINEDFKNIEKIQKQIQKTTNKKCRHLSMGMSGDYKEALENGSTFIRIGTKLFKQRNEK